MIYTLKYKALYVIKTLSNKERIFSGFWVGKHGQNRKLYGKGD